MKNVVILFAAMIVAGCSGDKSEMKPFVECKLAAELLRDDSSWKVIDMKSKVYAMASNIDFPVTKSNAMRDQILATWELDSLPQAVKKDRVVAVFNSQVCARMHELSSISVQSIEGDI